MDGGRSSDGHGGDEGGGACSLLLMSLGLRPLVSVLSVVGFAFFVSMILKLLFFFLVEIYIVIGIVFPLTPAAL